MPQDLGTAQVTITGNLSPLKSSFDEAIYMSGLHADKAGTVFGKRFGYSVGRNMGPVTDALFGVNQLGTGFGISAGLAGAVIKIGKAASDTSAELGRYKRALENVERANGRFKDSSANAEKALSSLLETANTSKYNPEEIFQLGTIVAGKNQNVVGAAQDVSVITDALEAFQIKRQDLDRFIKNFPDLANRGDKKLQIRDTKELQKIAPTIFAEVVRQFGKDVNPLDKISSMTGNEFMDFLMQTGIRNKGLAAQNANLMPEEAFTNFVDTMNTGLRRTGDQINNTLLLPIIGTLSAGAKVFGEINDATGGQAGLITLAGLLTTAIKTGNQAMANLILSTNNLSMAAANLASVTGGIRGNGGLAGFKASIENPKTVREALKVKAEQEAFLAAKSSALGNISQLNSSLKSNMGFFGESGKTSISEIRTAGKEKVSNLVAEIREKQNLVRANEELIKTTREGSITQAYGSPAVLKAQLQALEKRQEVLKELKANKVGTVEHEINGKSVVTTIGAEMRANERHMKAIRENHTENMRLSKFEQAAKISNIEFENRMIGDRITALRREAIDTRGLTNQKIVDQRNATAESIRMEEKRIRQNKDTIIGIKNGTIDPFTYATGGSQVGVGQSKFANFKTNLMAGLKSDGVNMAAQILPGLILGAIAQNVEQKGKKNTAGIISAIATGATLGAMIGQFTPVGALGGGAIGGGIGGIVGVATSQEIRKSIQDRFNATQDKFESNPKFSNAERNFLRPAEVLFNTIESTFEGILNADKDKQDDAAQKMKEAVDKFGNAVGTIVGVVGNSGNRTTQALTELQLQFVYSGAQRQLSVGM